MVYVLTGGLAVSLHGIERSTMDIDVTVAMTTANLSALVAMARDLRMVPVLLLLWRHCRITCSVASLYPPVNFATLREHAVTYKAGDILVIVEDLIALKQAVDGPLIWPTSSI